jgi:hypothetical protein
MRSCLSSHPTSDGVFKSSRLISRLGRCLTCRSTGAPAACRPVSSTFPPPLRSGGNAALSGECLVSPPLRYGENKALEWMPCGHRSAPHYADMETKYMAIDTQPRIPKIKSFIALFDILGFKDLIRNDQLDDVYRVFLRLKDVKNNAKEMVGHLEALLETRVVTVLNYSDSFLMYTLDINDIKQDRIDNAFHAILAACDSLFVAANENRLPIRGSITVGDIIICDDLVIGKPIVDAYEMEQKQEWIGCWVSRNALDLLNSKRGQIYFCFSA